MHQLTIMPLIRFVCRYHKAAVTCVCWQEQDGRLASASRDGSIALWRVYPYKKEL